MQRSTRNQQLEAPSFHTTTTVAPSNLASCPVLSRSLSALSVHTEMSAVWSTAARPRKTQHATIQVAGIHLLTNQTRIACVHSVLHELSLVLPLAFCMAQMLFAWRELGSDWRIVGFE